MNSLWKLVKILFLKMVLKLGKREEEIFRTNNEAVVCILLKLDQKKMREAYLKNNATMILAVQPQHLD
jgi:hypothetical protein